MKFFDQSSILEKEISKYLTIASSQESLMFGSWTRSGQNVDAGKLRSRSSVEGKVLAKYLSAVSLIYNMKKNVCTFDHFWGFRNPT